MIVMITKTSASTINILMRTTEAVMRMNRNDYEDKKKNFLVIDNDEERESWIFIITLIAHLFELPSQTPNHNT